MIIYKEEFGIILRWIVTYEQITFFLYFYFSKRGIVKIDNWLFFSYHKYNININILINYNVNLFNSNSVEILFYASEREYIVDKRW